MALLRQGRVDFQCSKSERQVLDSTGVMTEWEEMVAQASTEVPPDELQGLVQRAPILEPTMP